MKPIKEIQEICKQPNNIGMDEQEYQVYDRFTTMLWETWKNWADDITREFWGSDEKPDKPTESFVQDYYNNFEFSELQFLNNN
ncbi:hypothetical protein DXA95_16245 [Odoribacter sp. OF09-27XD]|nr:hypothetical protein [Odoribacter sp. OF09-27XD]RHV89195.1 hypothetical protein DXA95_16245 [Odoribacter sp. OF09-27XD]